jgi:hypothetical protein
MMERISGTNGKNAVAKVWGDLEAAVLGREKFKILNFYPKICCRNRLSRPGRSFLWT